MNVKNTLIPLTVVGLLVSSAASVQARTEIQNKGSDTLVNVAQAWAESYKEVNPRFRVPLIPLLAFLAMLPPRGAIGNTTDGGGSQTT